MLRERYFPQQHQKHLQRSQLALDGQLQVGELEQVQV
jgi:hypothetical protein